VKFRVGDIVEAQISFIVIPLRGDQYKMSAVLRGLTLMDGTHTSVSEKLVLNILTINHIQQNATMARAAKSIITQPAMKRLTRKVGHDEEQLAETRAKMSRMDIDHTTAKE
jgi:hypothetical protein